MNCMKCGTQIPEDQVFCDHCLSVMAQHPVKPSAHIHLPKRAQAGDHTKKVTKKKRTPSLEEQLSAMRIKVLRLRLIAVVLVFLLCITAGFLALKVYEDYSVSDIGRNYTIDTSMND